MPLRVRGKAVGLCTFVNWGPANNLSATLTPWLLQEKVLGADGKPLRRIDPFLRHFHSQNQSFCQGRLGANMRKR